MSEAPETQLIREIQSLRGEVTLLREDVALMRSELGALTAVNRDHAETDGDARDAVRRLWAEGEKSGIAGDLDEVFDDVLAALPPYRPANP